MKIFARYCRGAFSLLEVQIAFVLVGIALAGLCPLLVVQSKQLRQIESRLDHQTTYYLIPATETWARKLGASATVQTTDPGSLAASPPMLIDNTDSGYSEMGSGWTTAASLFALGGTYRRHAAGTGQNTANWTFTGLDPGPYAVEVDWPVNLLTATNATFTISDGTNTLATTVVNQALPPLSDQYQGIWWSKLATVVLTGTTLKVTLTDQANGRVEADAVRLVALRNTVQVLSVDHSLTTTDLTAHVSVTAYAP